jgi:hypothetical protein
MLRLRPNLYRKHVWQRQAAVQFYGDEAMKLLRDAVAKGFKDAARMKTDWALDVIWLETVTATSSAQMKKDSDLDPLRQRSDFQQLLQELLGPRWTGQ